MDARLRFCLVLTLLSGTVMCSAIAGLAFWFWPTAKRIDAASASLLQCTWWDGKRWRANPSCLPSVTNAITGGIRKSTTEIAVAMPAIAASAKESAAKSVEASQKVIDLVEQGRKVLVELETVLHGLRGAEQVISEVRLSIAHVNVTTLPALDAALQPLGNDLNKVGTLLDDLHRQIETNGPVDKVVSDLDVAVRALNARLEDKNIADAVGHLNGASANLERLIGYIADAFSPRHESFWKSLGLRMIPLGLGHLIPQRVSVAGEPTVNVKEANK